MVIILSYELEKVWYSCLNLMIDCCLLLFCLIGWLLLFDSLRRFDHLVFFGRLMLIGFCLWHLKFYSKLFMVFIYFIGFHAFDKFDENLLFLLFLNLVFKPVLLSSDLHLFGPLVFVFAWNFTIIFQSSNQMVLLITLTIDFSD